MPVDQILQGMNMFISKFGSIVVIPVILFIISLLFRIQIKEAFTSALYAGIGLTGFMWIVSQYLIIIIPTVKNMVEQTGIHLPIIDVGWQTVALTVYATQAGMIYLGVGLLFQLFIFIIGWTNIFQPSGLWDNYSYMIWGSIVYIFTKDLWLSLAFMVTLNLWSTLGYEILAKRWARYYQYPNCTIVQMHLAEIVPFALLANWFLNRLGMNKINWQPQVFQKKLGFWGDPIVIGFSLGFLLGFLGNLNRIKSLDGWGNIALVTIATTTVMAIFPRVADIFGKAFSHLAAASNQIARIKNRDVVYIGVDDSTVYGEPATLISGLLLIPIMIVFAAIIPGNKVLPLVDLIALPFMVEVMVAISNGNIFKVILAMAIWFGIGLVGATTLAPLFTEIYKQNSIGQTVGDGYIVGFSVMAKPFWVIFTQSLLHWKWIALFGLFISYWPVAIWVKKNKKKIQNAIEREAHYGEASEKLVSIEIEEKIITKV